MADKQPKTATIKIHDDTHGGKVEGAHNGVRFSVPVGSEVDVSEGTLTALQDSGVNLTVIKPLSGEGADEGSSAPSERSATALRDVLPTDDQGINSPTGEPATLSQLTDEQATDAKLAQSANADTSDRGTGVGVEQRGLPADTSSTNDDPKPAAKRTTSAKRASSTGGKSK